MNTTQKVMRTITSGITLALTDIFTTIRCNSASAITITLPTVSGFPNFNCDIHNDNSGDVTCNGLVIGENCHAHVACDGTDWSVVIGGGEETDPVFVASEAYNITSTDTTNWNNKSDLELGETETSAYRGDRGKIAYDHSQTAHAPSDAQKNSDILKSEIEAKLTGLITSHTHASGGGSISAADLTTRYEPITDGDPYNPEFMFDEYGDVVMGEVSNV